MLLRSLPSVDQVLRNLKQQLNGLPHKVVVAEVQSVLSERRDAILRGIELESTATVEELVLRRLGVLFNPSLRPVINATGIILHTNLGRAPLPETPVIPRYSNLEYDLVTGKRGKRDMHTAALLNHVIGKPAIVVNNNAAAVYLVLNELASGGEVIVSRGELIEIGDGFRIPEIMLRAGVVLREVGTTNRTNIEDYRDAINERTRLILRVHPSNFHMSGFTRRTTLPELSGLARERGVPLYEDLGSGCVIDLSPYGIDEPVVSASISAGVDIVSFSCDKLLGGPQAGIIGGDAELVQRIRRNPMYRAFRVDKLVISALETTLRQLLAENWNGVPTMRMIVASVDELYDRAIRVTFNLESLGAVARESESPIGGGSTPDQRLPTWVVEITAADAVEFERALRRAKVPVIARIERDKIILDMRTVSDEEENDLITAVHSAALI